MDVTDLQWLVGLSVSVVVAIATIAVTAFRSMSAKLDKAVTDLRRAVKEGDDGLHERVNRLRQDVSDNYVRRVDLDGHLGRLDTTLKEMRDDLKIMVKAIARLQAGGSKE